MRANMQNPGRLGRCGSRSCRLERCGGGSERWSVSTEPATEGCVNLDCQPASEHERTPCSLPSLVLRTLCVATRVDPSSSERFPARQAKRTRRRSGPWMAESVSSQRTKIISPILVKVGVPRGSGAMAPNLPSMSPSGSVLGESATDGVHAWITTRDSSDVGPGTLASSAAARVAPPRPQPCAGIFPLDSQVGGCWGAQSLHAPCVTRAGGRRLNHGRAPAPCATVVRGVQGSTVCVCVRARRPRALHSACAAGGWWEKDRARPHLGRARSAGDDSDRALRDPAGCVQVTGRGGEGGSLRSLALRKAPFCIHARPCKDTQREQWKQTRFVLTRGRASSDRVPDITRMRGRL